MRMTSAGKFGVAATDEVACKISPPSQPLMEHFVKNKI
jgi:hypothetical protein